MKFAKKVVIPVLMNDNLVIQLNFLKEMQFLNHSEVHFVHIYQTITQAALVGDKIFVYPPKAEREQIEKDITERLKMISFEVLPIGFKGLAKQSCLFSDYPRNHMAELIKESNTDLVIIPTRKKHGLFDSSYAQFLNKHTDANIFFIKY